MFNALTTFLFTLLCTHIIDLLDFRMYNFTIKDSMKVITKKQYDMMETITLETMPRAMSLVLDKLDSIERRINQPEPSKPPKENLNSQEAREFLKEQGYDISEFTMNKKASLGEMPPHTMLGRNRVFKRSDLEAWVQSGCPNWNELEASKRIAENLNK